MRNVRIKTRRKELQLTQSDVAHVIGVSKTSVSQWEHGETAPKGENLFALCKILQCDPNWLLFGEEKETLLQPVPVVDAYPFIQWSQLYHWPEFHLPQDVTYLPCPIKCSRKTFILPVEGISMEPQFYEGDFIFVDPNVKVANGKCVVARAQEQIVLKQLLIESNQTYLRSTNPLWPDPIINIDKVPATVIGVVIFAGRSL